MKRGLNITVYGPNKTGKTLAATMLAACGGVVIADGDAPESARTLFGLSGFTQLPAATLGDMAELIKVHAGKVPTIVGDDLSIVTSRSFPNKDWDRLDALFMELDRAVTKAQDAGTHVVFTAHEQPARMSSGKYVRGGPSLPGQFPERFTSRSSLVFRAVYESTAAPWQYVFRTGPQADYISGTRVAGIWPDPSPMNLAEGLRLAGYDIPRPKGLEWIEPFVTRASGKILEVGIDNWREILRKAAEQLDGKHPLPHLRYALQDALHRAILRNSAERLETMFKEPTSAVDVAIINQ